MKKTTKLSLVFLIILTVFPSEINIANAASDKVLIRNLYYGLQQAVQTGSAAGIAYIEKNNYPKLFNTGSNWQRWKKAEIQAGFQELISPDLTTMESDPTWMWGGGFCHAAMTKPPKGKTYIFNVTTSAAVAGGQVQSASLQLHATILNGRAYFYIDICKAAK